MRNHQIQNFISKNQINNKINRITDSQYRKCDEEDILGKYFLGYRNDGGSMLTFNRTEYNKN